MKFKNTSSFLRYWNNRMSAIDTVLSGLAGEPFHWNMGGQTTRKNLKDEFGITLVTRTWLEKRGYVLNRGAVPVGTIYFGSPISSDCPVFVLECQAWLKDPAKLAKSEAAEAARRKSR